MKNPLLDRLIAVLAASLALAAANGATAADTQSKKAIPIRHVIIIMQENRSFDSYFGTFPGADGIPAEACIPGDPSNPGGNCFKPFHDPHDQNAGGPHRAASAQSDLDDGIHKTRMDGFIYQQVKAPRNCRPDAPDCSTFEDGISRRDVIGYHTDDEIPNYWTYARKFVLQDHMFEGVRSWSWPSHLELTSEWVAACSNSSSAASCVTDAGAKLKPEPGLQLPWANLFQLLDAHGVSWKYYVSGGYQPDCDDDEMACPARAQNPGVPSIWNPPPFFSSVKRKGATYLAQHNPDAKVLLTDLKNGTLPQVSWVAPTDNESEHPPNSVTRGMEYVTRMVNAVMESAYWKDTAIFIAWDDWGGFYDHVPPPNVDRNPTSTPIQGYGLRVPGLMISAYAKAGTIDHAVLSFDSYATFIEDLFMNGARLNPTALGNPDHRPDIRDSLTEVHFPDGTTAPIGNLMDEFDFTQVPLSPVKLTTDIPPGIRVRCASTNTEHCTNPTVTVLWDGVGKRNFIYHIQRDGIELPQCTGTATQCTDVPPSGAHFYRAYSVSPKGVKSPLSAVAEADAP